MPTAPDDRREAVRELVERMTAAQDRRLDDHDGRIRAVELEQARASGASSGFARIVPWIALVVGIGGLLLNVAKL